MFPCMPLGERSDDMHAPMELRRAHWTAAVRLAMIVSAVAVAVALALNAFGDVSQTALVVAVIVVGFVVSWIHSGRDTDHTDTDRTGGPFGESSSIGPGDRGDHSARRVSAVRLHHPAR